MSFLLDKLSELENNVKPGKSIDFDGAWPGECADLPRLFIDRYLAIPTRLYVGNNGVLDGFFSHFDPKEISILAESGTNRNGMRYRTQRIDNVNNLQRGDIVFRTGWPLDPVWMPQKSKYHNYLGGHDSGHVGIFVNRDTPGKYMLYDQNWSPLGGKRVAYSLHDNTSFVGAIRIVFEESKQINQTNMEEYKHKFKTDVELEAYINSFVDRWGLNRELELSKYNIDNFPHEIKHALSQGNLGEVLDFLRDRITEIKDLRSRTPEIKEIIKEVTVEPDLSKYISIKEYNDKVVELQNKIQQLSLEHNSSSKPAGESKKFKALELSQMWDKITAGSIGLVGLLTFLNIDISSNDWKVILAQITSPVTLMAALVYINNRQTQATETYIKKQAEIDVKNVVNP